MRKHIALALASTVISMGLVGVASAAITIRDSNPRFIVVDRNTYNPPPPSNNGPPPNNPPPSNNNPPPPPPKNYYPPLPPPNTITTSVPEPATLGLLGLGALGAAVFKRRRR